ncbi:hypothetical protein PLICRDRAFT_28393 [Plicaturopsis crispa FD-325 SS-3]|nr:hypothetical protein PLICRDRAFT_28393 [Plicaturopsis crispa FD-325 SS-3]
MTESTSRLELLWALCDVLRGDSDRDQFFPAGNLHGDISAQSIHIDDRDVPGKRGVLVDLDSAVVRSRLTSSCRHDLRTGSYAFQSVQVLLGHLPHTYLDDLESFFYVLCSICFDYEHGGKHVPERPVFLRKWEAHDAESAALAKWGFFSLSRELPELPLYFGDPFRKLLANLKGFCYTHISRRVDNPSLTWTDDEAAKHYATYIGYVEDAIAEVERIAPYRPYQPPPPPPVPHTVGVAAPTASATPAPASVSAPGPCYELRARNFASSSSLCPPPSTSLRPPSSTSLIRSSNGESNPEPSKKKRTEQASASSSVLGTSKLGTSSSSKLT